MTTSILIVTHAKHAPFCQLLLRSLAKHAIGFERALLIVPVADAHVFFPMVEDANRQGGILIEIAVNWEPLNQGHVGQCITKTYADVWLPEADRIVHLDADCVATRSFSPSNYVDHEGRIVILTKPYERAGDAQAWRFPVELALGTQTPLETMQSPQLAFRREVYRCVRNTVEKRQSEPFTHYLLRQNCWPEFPALGHVALNQFSEWHRGIDVDSPEGKAWRRFIKQGWSHYVDDPNPAVLREQLAAMEAAIG